MAWYHDIVATITGNKPDVAAIKQKLFSGEESAVLTQAELEIYINNIQNRVHKLCKELRDIYGKHGVKFKGFRALNQACDEFNQIIKNGSEENYNNLIKTESSISSELRRHLSLIRMATDQNRAKVIDKINSDPSQKEKFDAIFGHRLKDSEQYKDGRYQQLWSEIHKLTEYMIIQKDKVIH